jgi:hypothetical protein
MQSKEAKVKKLCKEHLSWKDSLKLLQKISKKNFKCYINIKFYLNIVIITDLNLEMNI